MLLQWKEDVLDPKTISGISLLPTERLPSTIPKVQAADISKRPGKTLADGSRYPGFGNTLTQAAKQTSLFSNVAFQMSRFRNWPNCCGPFIQIRALPAARLFRVKACSKWPIATYPSRPFRATLRPSAELEDSKGGGMLKQMTNAPWICLRS